MIANLFRRRDTGLTTKAAQTSTPSPAWSGRFVGYAVMAVIYALLLVATTSSYFGDTGEYASSIVQYDRGIFASLPNLLWESGHLYWRPLGLVFYRAFAELIPYSRTGEHELAATIVLVAITMACGLVCALLFYEIALHFLKRNGAAILVATSFLSFYAFLNYVHTGSAYIPGLMGVLLGLWFAIIAVERCRNPSTYGLLSGAFVGLAVLLWLPYAVALPGILAASLLWNLKGERAAFRDRLRVVSCISVSAVCVVAIGYLFAILQLNIFSIMNIKQWLLTASHGWSQNKRFLRLATGLPRSFIYIGNGGLLLKRYVLRDPYAHTGLMYLAQHYLWKLIIFYIFAFSLVLSLFRSDAGRRIVWIFLAGIFPTLVFAVVIFEPGSSERYLPIYPFACLALAYVLSQFSRNARTGVVILAFVALTITTNVSALWKPAVKSRNASAISRVESLQGRVAPQGLVALVTFNDGVYQFTTSYPFDPVNRRGQLPIYDVIQVANLRILRWKQEFAQRALESLGHSANVWVSKRFLAEQPDPTWDWVEGDDIRIVWRDLPLFFRQFSYCDSIGGPDGFLRLEPSRENFKRLEAIHD